MPVPPRRALSQVRCPYRRIRVSSAYSGRENRQKAFRPENGTSAVPARACHEALGILDEGGLCGLRCREP